MSFEISSDRLELVAHGFSFPTSLTFDEAGTPYVAEAGLPFGGAEPGGGYGRLGKMVSALYWREI